MSERVTRDICLLLPKDNWLKLKGLIKMSAPKEEGTTVTQQSTTARPFPTRPGNAHKKRALGLVFLYLTKNSVPERNALTLPAPTSSHVNSLRMLTCQSKIRTSHPCACAWVNANDYTSSENANWCTLWKLSYRTCSLKQYSPIWFETEMGQMVNT